MVLGCDPNPNPKPEALNSLPFLGGRIKGTLGDIDPLNKVPLKRARSRVQKGYPLRGLPNTTPYFSPIGLRPSGPRGLKGASAATLGESDHPIQNDI